MSANTTAIGKTPFAAVERLPDGDVLLIFVNCTGSHYCVLMQRYSPDLSQFQTVLNVVMPLQNHKLTIRQNSF